MEAYKDMLRAGFQADVYTYSSLIQACQCCNSRWKDASRFFDQMKAEGSSHTHATSSGKQQFICSHWQVSVILE